jgi:putative phosphoribosyl transferase
MQENLDSNSYIYEDRAQAVEDLLSILPKETMQKEQWVLLALSRGSVEMAERIADSFSLLFDIFIVKPILAPNNADCQIAMVSETKEIVIHEALVESFGISEDYIYAEAKRRYQDDILDNIHKFRQGLPLSNLKDKTVLLIDEGCETGLSTMCALKSVLNLHTKKVLLATPVIAEDLFHHLDLKVDKIYTNHRIHNFIEVNYYYKNLERIPGKLIRKKLEKSAYYMPYQKEKADEL